MEELSFKQIMQHPLVRKGRGRLDELTEAIGEKGVRRLQLMGEITSMKPKTWYRMETWYMNHWFLTKQGKRWVKLFDERYTIWDRINDFFVVYVLFGKTRFDKIRETLALYDKDC